MGGRAVTLWQLGQSIDSAFSAVRRSAKVGGRVHIPAGGITLGSCLGSIRWDGDDFCMLSSLRCISTCFSYERANLGLLDYIEFYGAPSGKTLYVFLALSKY